MESKKKTSPPVDGADRLTMTFNLISMTPSGEANAQMSFDVTGLDSFERIENRNALLRCFAQCLRQTYMKIAERLNGGERHAGEG